MDELRLRITNNWRIMDCNVMLFTETWLHNGIPDNAIELAGRHTLRADRTAEDSDFLRKVYTLLSLQIILTTATSALFKFSQTIKDFPPWQIFLDLLNVCLFFILGRLWLGGRVGRPLILTNCVTAWYESCSVADRKVLQQVVKTAQRIIGTPLPAIEEVHKRRCLRRARSILIDSSHRHFQLLPFGRRYRSLQTKTSSSSTSRSQLTQWQGTFFLPASLHVVEDFKLPFFVRLRKRYSDAMSGEKYPRSSIEDDFNYGTNVATASIQIRMDFLRKVYTLLSLQIILTTATSALFMFSQAIKDFVHASPAVVLVSALGSLVLLLALAMYRHQHPINLYLLLIFTLLEAVSVATALTFYEYSIVLQALFLTCAVFAGLTAYTFQSKRDFSKMGAGLFACLWILIIASLMRFFFDSDSTELVLAGAGALIFCGFIIYDTNMLMKQLSPEEHILASINLYLDIVNLFLHTLRLLDSMKKQ